MSFENWIAARQPTKRYAVVTQPTRRLSCGQAAMEEYLTQRADSLVLESKQAIVSLGYPEIVAKLFYQKFGKNAYLLARWFREFYGNRFGDGVPSNWWQQVDLSMLRQDLTISALTNLYTAAASFDSDAYSRLLDKYGLSSDDALDDYYLKDQAEWLLSEIESRIFNSTVFKAHNVMSNIANGTIKDVAPYKNLSLNAAEEKYDRKNVFQTKEPIKTYPNGYKWIDVGQSCNLVGSMMKNCGSSGSMSDDPDRTILTLFDPNNTAHAVVTYSPNQQRISGDQGGAHTELKPEYHAYVLDLAKHLGVRFDADKSKSPLLKLKSKLGVDVVEMPGEDKYNRFFSFRMNGSNYYTDADGKYAIADFDLENLKYALDNGSVTLKFVNPNIIRTALAPANRNDLQRLVRFFPINGN